MKILSFQPYSIYSNGGGARILRRLYSEHEAHVSSLVLSTTILNLHPEKISERYIYTYPMLKPWMRSYLRNVNQWLAEAVFKKKTIHRLVNSAKSKEYDILHIIDHGLFSSALLTQAKTSNKKIWVSFHDHYLTTNSPFNEVKKLWNLADRRLVISEEMGIEYCRVFGPNTYEMITDGISESEISQANNTFTPSPINIYFAGLLHLDYYPLFETLANGLDLLTSQGYSFNIVFRGTQQLKFLSNRKFQVEYRPFSLDDNELKLEMDAATILYLPIKFTNPPFYLYSLSTKLIGYLGGCGAILYHGPSDSAACKLIQNANAAACCTSLETDDIVKSILTVLEGANKFSENSKKLAREKFNLTAIRSRFWQETL